MQPSSRELQGLNSPLSRQQRQHMPLQEQHIQNGQHQQTAFDPTSSHDDILEQMLSSLPPPSCSWPDLTPSSSSLGPNPKSLWDDHLSAPIGLHKSRDDYGPPNPENVQPQFHHHHQQQNDQSALLASKLRLYQISGGGSNSSAAIAAAAAKALMLQQQLMLSSGLAGDSPTGLSGAGESGLLQMLLSLGNAHSFDRAHNEAVDDSPFKSPNSGSDGSIQALYNGFAGSVHGTAQQSNQSQHFHTDQLQGGSMQAETFGAQGTMMNQQPSGGGGTASGTQQQPRQRVRARRGQATDPHSIAERLRRERIAERMKALQELVPNANKTDKASMLDEIIDYVKFLQLQVKVLSMSRLGGAAAVAPLVADMSSEGGVRECIKGGTGSGGSRGSDGNQAASSSNDSMTVTEHQVAKLMEEDMGSAMQYLQRKGLCLMPISLATAISTATCQSRNSMNAILNNPLLVSSGEGGVAAIAGGGGGGLSSPSMSVLTVQSVTIGNTGGEVSVKDAASVSKP